MRKVLALSLGVLMASSAMAVSGVSSSFHNVLVCLEV